MNFKMYFLKNLMWPKLTAAYETFYNNNFINSCVIYSQVYVWAG